MRQIYFAAELVANTTKGSLFPNDIRAIFAELEEDGALEPAVALCPVDRAVKAPKDWAAMSKDGHVAWAVAHTSYTWTGGGIDSVRAVAAGVGDQVMLLTERPRDHVNHGGGMNVAFADGTVTFVTNAELPAVTARSDAARAKLK